MACAGAASRSSASSARAALYAAVAFVLLLVLCMVVANVAGTSRHPYDLCLAERQSPPAAVARHPGTIFVSIASYRDHECPATVESLFAMASDPTRIHVGLCIQNAEGDPSARINVSRASRRTSAPCPCRTAGRAGPPTRGTTAPGCTRGRTTSCKSTATCSSSRTGTIY